ncbi:hypothetical protein QYE76_018765 [Lolium multiflorum]|uniref:CCHC-type domain-containing protein n=1 Tax=Lolium multiflorum TaxID=4521 RepID=A0AAD8PYZ8_LOLMU|nr:hypothetical protein QYE76_018765 [Lolium multiflorum]
MEREAKQKEEAEGAARDQFPPPPPPMTQQNFVQYMQLVEERQRVTLEQQNKFFQELLQRAGVERQESGHLARLPNTKPISFAYARSQWTGRLAYGSGESSTLLDADKKGIYLGGVHEEVQGINVPESIVELKRREFESLEQKDKAILTYVGEFSKLSRYAVEEVNTEDKKKKRFLRGLSPQFKVQLRMMRATEFQELVDAAITLEDDFKQLQEEKRKKAKFEPKRFSNNKPNTSLNFKPRYNNNNNNNNNYYGSRKNQAFQTANQIVCRICGFKGHASKDCRKPRIICFGCRQEGHMMKDCPNKKNGGGQSEEEEAEEETPEGTGRIRSPWQAELSEEVVNSDQAVIGTLQILTHPGKVLFDTVQLHHSFLNNSSSNMGLVALS